MKQGIISWTHKIGRLVPFRTQGRVTEDMTSTLIKLKVNPVEWIEEYGNYLLRYALCYVRGQEVAEDLVQETFLAALQSQGSFAGKSTEKTWLVGILKHKLIDHYRKTSRYSQLEDNVEINSVKDGFVRTGRWTGFWNPGSEPQGWHLNPACTAERQAFREVLNSCLSQMTPRMAAAFQLREVEQLSTKEICELLGVSERNLWVMLHRARQLLRRCIELKWLTGSKGNMKG